MEKKLGFGSDGTNVGGCTRSRFRVAHGSRAGARSYIFLRRATVPKCPSFKRASAVIFRSALTCLYLYLGTVTLPSATASSSHDHDHSDHRHEEKHDEHGHEEAGHDDNDHSDHDHGHGDGHSDVVTLTDEAVALFDLGIESVRRQHLTRKISAPARVVYNFETVAHVGATVTGRVTEIRYRIGDLVQKGDVLLVLESTELGMAQSELLQKHNEVDIATISLDVAKAEYERAKILVAGQGISQAEYLQVEGRYNIARGTVRNAQSAAQTQENNLHLLGMNQERIDRLIKTGEVDPVYVISAPISGEIVARQATLGDVVKPDDDELMTLANLDRVWVIASIPEAHTRVVDVGAKARITFAALGGEPLEGQVTYIASTLDERTRTVQARIEVVAKGTKLRPGMFGRVELAPAHQDTGSDDGMLAVPQSAVFVVEGSSAVFVVDEHEKNTFAKRPITTGPVVDGYLPVLSGLQEGERIVAKGGFILKAELGKESAEHEH